MTKLLLSDFARFLTACPVPVRRNSSADSVNASGSRCRPWSRRWKNASASCPVRRRTCTASAWGMVENEILGGYSLLAGSVRLLAQCGHVDPELLGFLVKMAALQTECLRGISNVVVIVLELGDHDFTLEALNAIGEGSRARVGRVLA